MEINVFNEIYFPKKLKVLGDGAFGIVLYGKVRYNGTNEAIEVAIKKPRKGKVEIENINSEIELMNKLNHKNIVKLIGLSIKSKENDGIPWLILEYMEYGSVMNCLMEYPQICDEAFKMRVTKDVAAAMNYLNVKMSIVHGDLHLNNCLVSGSGKIIKVSDFGLSFEIKNEKITMDGPIGRYGRPKGDITCILGPYWKPPERIPGKKYCSITIRPGDIWQYGIALFELWNNGDILPFENMNPSVASYLVARGYNPLDFNECNAPERILNIMRRCFSFAPIHRPTFDRIVKVLDDIHSTKSFMESLIDITKKFKNYEYKMNHQT